MSMQAKQQDTQAVKAEEKRAEKEEKKAGGASSPSSEKRAEKAEQRAEKAEKQLEKGERKDEIEERAAEKELKQAEQVKVKASKSVRCHVLATHSLGVFACGLTAEGVGARDGLLDLALALACACARAPAGREGEDCSRGGEESCRGASCRGHGEAGGEKRCLRSILPSVVPQASS